MARLPRIEGEALLYYIYSEGRNNEIIFQDDQDRLYFKNLLRQLKIRGKLTFYGYVLLPRQYIFLLETQKKNLCQCMHLINSHYVNYYNRRHNRRNKLFRDRYKCFVVDKRNHLLEVSCYLHVLPEKEGLTNSLLTYQWSSFPGYIKKERREDWIDYDRILKQFPFDDQDGSSAYEKFVHQKQTGNISSLFKNLRNRNILESRDFKKEIHRSQVLSSQSSQEDGDAIAEKIIELVNHSSSWTSLKNKRKKLRAKNLSRNAAIYFLKQYTDLDNQQINGYFRSLNKSSISQMSRRFNIAKEKNRAVAKISDSLEKQITKIVLNEEKI